MYKFYNYIAKTAQTFIKRDDLFNHIDSLCEQENLDLPSEKQRMIELKGDTPYRADDGDSYDCFAISGYGKLSPRSVLLGFIKKTPCNDK